MELKQKFKELYPKCIYLDRPISTEAEKYLKEEGWLRNGEKLLATEKPGEGNMNFVIRLRTSQRSIVLKQSRPWVEKYPQIDAPIERIYVEQNFYRFIAPHQGISQYTPKVVGFDPDNYTLLLEDLGEGADYSFLYQEGKLLTDEELKALSHLLSTLHHIYIPQPDRQYFDNQAMKSLNHEHIFIYPFSQDNGFDLDGIQVGLQALALPYQSNDGLKSKVTHLGSLYLQNHQVLLHGDYYPGSWLKVPDGLKLIDPEFSYFGKAEFDLGIMLGHLKMSQHSQEAIGKTMGWYQPPADFDEDLAFAFAGVEIIRRIIGLAQLPLSLSLQEKGDLLAEASELIYNYKA